MYLCMHGSLMLFLTSELWRLWAQDDVDVCPAWIKVILIIENKDFHIFVTDLTRTRVLWTRGAPPTPATRASGGLAAGRTRPGNSGRRRQVTENSSWTRVLRVVREENNNKTYHNHKGHQKIKIYSCKFILIQEIISSSSSSRPMSRKWFRSKVTWVQKS